MKMNQPAKVAVLSFGLCIVLAPQLSKADGLQSGSDNYDLPLDTFSITVELTQEQRLELQNAFRNLNIHVLDEQIVEHANPKCCC